MILSVSFSPFSFLCSSLLGISFPLSLSLSLLIGPASHKKGRKSVKQMKVNSIFKSDGETVREGRNEQKKGEKGEEGER